MVRQCIFTWVVSSVGEPRPRARSRGIFSIMYPRAWIFKQRELPDAAETAPQDAFTRIIRKFCRWLAGDPHSARSWRALGNRDSPSFFVTTGKDHVSGEAGVIYRSTCLAWRCLQERGGGGGMSGRAPAVGVLLFGAVRCGGS